MATLCEDVEDQLCTPEANRQSVGNVVVRLDAIFCWSAGWCGRVDDDRLAGIDKGWPDYVTLIARPRGEFEQRFPEALSLYAALRYPFPYCALLPRHMQNWL